MEKIIGVVQKIIFKSDESGYAVVSIKIDFKKESCAKYQDILISNLLTVTCYYDRLPIKDEEFEYTGEFVENKFGIQLKATSYKRVNEDSLEAVCTYLSSEYFPGIGKVIATKVYNTLGKGCLEKIKNDRKVLDSIPGLTDAQKDSLYYGIIENIELEENLLIFVQMGFTMAMAKKLNTSLNKEDIKKLNKNPYILIDKVEGIGFIKADKIALEMGIAKDSIVRLEACIVFFLNNYIYESGNSYFEKDELKQKVFEVLNREEELITNDVFMNILDTLKNKHRIIIDENNNISPIEIHSAEEKFAVRIVSLIKSELPKNYNDEEINNALKKVEEANDIEYSNMQKKAIMTALKENISIITGGPGTGKTTIVRGIIDTFARLFKSDNIMDTIGLLAPTGRASKRLNEVTKHQAQTIHKVLGFDGKSYRYSSNNPLDFKLVIIDEMSMVDIVLVSRLFEALLPECRVIIVGDVDQIPSVSPGEVLADLIKSKEITTIRLDHIHRQAANSTIISLAHSINNGIVPENILEKQHDRNFINLEESSIIESIEKIIVQAQSKNMDLLKDIQVLIPMYRGPLGIDSINFQLQNKFNPLEEGQDEIKTTKQRFRVNDKVIQLVNRNQEQIMNGDIGYIHHFIYTNESITGISVQFENTNVEYNYDEYEQLKLAYAISIHKSQGSEFKTVIIPFSYKYFSMLKRRLYYTAITRAKSYLIMIGPIDCLQIAARSTGYSRKTKLLEEIKKLLNGNDSISPYDFM